MSALPKAIKKQIEAAEKAHAEAYKKEETPPAEPKAEDVNDEAAQPKEAEKGIQQAQATEPQQAITPEEPADETPPVTDETPPAETDAWEKRYNILKGKYDAEVPRQAKQIRELRNELEGVRGLLAQMSEQKPAEIPSSATQQPPAGTPTRLLKPEEIADYGEELISVIQRGAQEVFNPEVATLREELNQLKKQLGGVNQTLHSSKRDTVLDTLTREVPDWKTLNEDELFLSWLDQIDTFSGQPRQALLDRAFEDADAARVVAFFKGYLEENAALQPTQQVETSPARNTSTKLDDMVAPGKPKGASGGAQKGDKRMWTQQQIADFYRKVNAGKYKSQPDKQMAIERDIVAAGREGRITT